MLAMSIVSSHAEVSAPPSIDVASSYLDGRSERAPLDVTR